MTVVSIIICTRNRCESLRATLESLAICEVPTNAEKEIIVVDNGSDDQTAAVVKSYPENSGFCYVHEPVLGLSYARNCGIRHARGSIIVFVDDDVRPFPRSVASLINPILGGKVDATVGRIEMAPDLKRPWMTTEHSAWLACNSDFMMSQPPSAPVELVGAFMAFSRRVLEKVPGFDVSIGVPFASGEETLFSMQLRKANYGIAFVPDAVAEHHFDPNRLTRKAFLQLARLGAASDWYILHHWTHEAASCSSWSVIRAWLRIQYYRIKRWREWWTHEAMPAWEKNFFQEFYKSWFCWKNRRALRNYEPMGLMRSRLARRGGIEKPAVSGLGSFEKVGGAGESLS